MKVTGSATLGHPVDAVYAALTDPAMLVRTIPGCQRLEQTGPDSYRATVAAGVAAIKGLFDGGVRLADQAPPHALTLHATGIGTPGTVDAVARVRLAAGPEGGTLISYDADATIGGVIGGVGQRMLAGVARRTAGAFFAAVERELTAARVVAPAQASPVPAEAAPVAASVEDSTEASASVSDEATVPTQVPVGGPLPVRKPASSGIAAVNAAAPASTGIAKTSGVRGAPVSPAMAPDGLGSALRSAGLGTIRPARFSAVGGRSAPADPRARGSRLSGAGSAGRARAVGGLDIGVEPPTGEYPVAAPSTVERPRPHPLSVPATAEPASPVAAPATAFAGAAPSAASGVASAPASAAPSAVPASAPAPAPVPAADAAGVPAPAPVPAGPAAPAAVWTRPATARDRERLWLRDLMLAAALGAAIALVGVLIGAIITR